MQKVEKYLELWKRLAEGQKEDRLSDVGEDLLLCEMDHLWWKMAQEEAEKAVALLQKAQGNKP